jgi:ribonuclease P/MRP protein subunit RPP40
MKLYKCLIRPRLEYAVQAWRPYLQKDIDLIEGVQRRATKLVVETKGMSYDERLKFLDMKTLKTRRVRGDLIEVFKIMKGFENVNKDKFFTMDTGCTRGHELKLFSRVVVWTVGNMLFRIELLICGIVYHRI